EPVANTISRPALQPSKEIL
ncbi:hypothetical protein A2U01_0045824, partial [Trifolium medium]|nr:hypothetical protein [Trifolium medium]